MVPGSPGKPSNPSCIIGDSSALIQLILGEQVQLLRELRSRYGISCLIPDAVEIELLYRVPKKYPDKASVLRKAFSNAAIKTLSPESLSDAGYKSAEALSEQIELKGREYALRVDRGEAFAHAAANLLQVPVLSHDLAALSKLAHSGVYVHKPVLRAFDIVIWAHQVGLLDPNDLKQFRRELLSKRESILPCFQDCSVVDGLPQFYQRICDSALEPLGRQLPNEGIPGS
ncbi:MAG: hypothetical protein SFV54_11935 [Bryobacteraceae bacterium]|nr:hypothetical protein [Bryobacteraceae bacterium]